MSRFFSFFLIILSFIFSSCEKQLEDVPEAGLVIPVSKVDSICGDVILSIEDQRYYHLGEQNYTYGGATYRSAFFGKISCISPFVDSLSTVVQNKKIYLVRIGNTLPIEHSISCFTCRATFATRPMPFFYVSPVVRGGL